MVELSISILSALWLGIVTSISPCPLATNVAAVSVLSRKVGNRHRALLGAVAYTLGRVTVYLALAILILYGLSSMASLSVFLRSEILPLIGPVLILTGMIVLGWIPLPISLKLGSENSAKVISRWGLAGEFCLGAMFALSFCPVSAALFFGSLIPLAVTSAVPPLPVILYGVGTALPVGLIAILIVVSSEMASRTLNQIQKVQRIAVIFTGTVLTGVGVWLTVWDTLGIRNLM